APPAYLNGSAGAMHHCCQVVAVLFTHACSSLTFRDAAPEPLLLSHRTYGLCGTESTPTIRPWACPACPCPVTNPLRAWNPSDDDTSDAWPAPAPAQSAQGARTSRVEPTPGCHEDATSRTPARILGSRTRGRRTRDQPMGDRPQGPECPL